LLRNERLARSSERPGKEEKTMKVLHIFRSEPDDLVRLFIRGMNADVAREVALHRGQVDYDQLVKEIFESDKVICWW
jgi:hypothetical protein